MWHDDEVRLIGIRLDNLTEKVIIQTSLFENIKTKEEDINLEHTIDKLKEKYGSETIKRASLGKK